MMHSGGGAKSFPSLHLGGGAAAGHDSCTWGGTYNQENSMPKATHFHQNHDAQSTDRKFRPAMKG